jgi:hypothetical protein
MKHALILTCAAMLSACTGDAEPYPRLLPTDQILAEPALPDYTPQAAVDAEAETRADALRRRADALRGPVIEPETLARIRAQQ